MSGRDGVPKSAKGLQARTAVRRDTVHSMRPSRATLVGVLFAANTRKSRRNMEVSVPAVNVLNCRILCVSPAPTGARGIPMLRLLWKYGIGFSECKRIRPKILKKMGVKEVLKRMDTAQELEEQKIRLHFEKMGNCPGTQLDRTDGQTQSHHMEQRRWITPRTPLSTFSCPSSPRRGHSCFQLKNPHCQPRAHLGNVLHGHLPPSLPPLNSIKYPHMNHWLINLILTFLEALRRLWQRITGRRPIPIPVRSRPEAPVGHSRFSLTLTNLRSPTGTRRGRHW